MQYAASIFKNIENPNLFMFNTMLRGYSISDKPKQAFGIFNHLRTDGFLLDQFSFVTILKACARELAFWMGIGIHGVVIRSGHVLLINVKNTLLHFYCVCGEIEDAHKLFDENTHRNDLISWNTLMGGYLHVSEPDMAISLIFDGLIIGKDVVLWNCMIDKYAKSGMIEESIALLESMRVEQLKPNACTLVGLLSACADSGALSAGLFINDYVKEEGLPMDAILGTALVDMYAKCGCLDKAIDVFKRMERKDVRSWTAMISSYGVHGKARNAIMLLYRMEEEGFKPNEITFLAVLSACSHGGLVTEGMECFERMVGKYGYLPKFEHYGCLIDLLGRAGMLEEAHYLIRSLPTKGDAIEWRALLAACRVYGNVELAECVKRVLVQIDNEHPTDSILISSTYAAAGRLPDQTRL
ncbi:PPR domain-containing protein/PPR_2 domain-containing protein, partial [Cephalotus follicularis]